MSTTETSTEIKAKILLDEANLAFSETSERRDSSGERNLDGSAWEEGRMEGEYDETDYQKILELQMRAAIVCDEHPELEDKTAQLFESISAENSQEVLETVLKDPNIMTLGKAAVTTFVLRFPTVQSFVNKGHPLVLAMDEYMLENADAQNWHDYNNIAKENGWV
ncbi:MAG: hypothetical protein HOL15_10450 [Nitrospinaceae bacterium]|nr:hypothetical protein [Nitrospina sp.]MBT5377223.1 hypothetical protein [Nitrospinaceae bacterium]MBT5867525.1 hypothetical protein [Nitrospinaceae bacterium]MBT6347213.1 hypothetical protein [Nitrospina sp.]